MKRILAMLLAAMLVLSMGVVAFAEGENPVIMQDFNAWGDSWKGAYNVGWTYAEGFDLTTITGIEVWLEDKDGNLIVKYIADEEQIAWQKENSYIARPSSAPFYQEYNGTLTAEIEDLDWSIVKGEAWAAFAPATAKIEVSVGETVYSGVNNNLTSEAEKLFTKVEAVAATCTTTGNIEYWDGGELGLFKDNKLTEEISEEDIATEIDADNHTNVVTKNAKPATKYEDGYTGDQVCEDCKEVVKKGAVIPANRPDPCDHKLDANGKCERCGVVIITYTDGKPAQTEEANPNTGAESAVAAVAAVAVLALAGAVVSKK